MSRHTDDQPMKHCKRCGTETERNGNGKCKPCARARAVAWRAANPEKAKAKDAAWSAANAEKVRARVAAWAAANPEKVRARKAAWAAANPEKGWARAAAWRAANPEKAKAQAVAWAAANHEKKRAKDAAWRAANPDKGRVYAHNRRARKKANGGQLSPDITDKLLKLQKGKCACCKQRLGKDYHLDHIVPLALGGAHADENMQLLRDVCNLKKGAKHPVDFMQQRGFLL